MFRINIPLLFLAAAIIMPVAASAQVQPRIAGLGDNTEYIRLLEREAYLSFREDSLNSAISRTRQEFRENRDNASDRERYASDILRLEAEIFDNRNESGIVAGQISAIEQDFIISNLSRDEDPFGEEMESISGSFARQNPNLVRNERFSNVLKRDDYISLLRAQRLEQGTLDFAGQFKANYTDLSLLESPYLSAENSHDADSIYGKYTALTAINQTIADSIASRWDYIFDNKIYAYNYLLEKMNDRETLGRLAAEINEIRDRIAADRDMVASPQVHTYFLQKELLLKYEKTLADRLFLDQASDSLARARNSFGDLVQDMPKIEFPERFFLDYSAIETSSPSKYNTRNPIPQTEVHPRGTIYRILLGSYSRQQQVSLFKGVYPLSYLRDESGKYNYYAGGFATIAEAGAAVDQLKRLGFRNPQAAVWIDGEYALIDLTRRSISQGAHGDRIYNLDLRPTGGDLPETVKETIRNFRESKDIARIGDRFVVGPFDDVATARELLEEIRSVDASLSSEITETIY